MFTDYIPTEDEIIAMYEYEQERAMCAEYDANYGEWLDMQMVNRAQALLT